MSNLKNPESAPVAVHPPSSCSASSSEHFELEGNVNGKWRLVAVHPTLAKANADAAEYEEWCKGAVNKWEGFRIVRVTTTRDIMPNIVMSQPEPLTLKTTSGQAEGLAR